MPGSISERPSLISMGFPGDVHQESRRFSASMRPRGCRSSTMPISACRRSPTSSNRSTSPTTTCLIASARMEAKRWCETASLASHEQYRLVTRLSQSARPSRAQPRRRRQHRGLDSTRVGPAYTAKIGATSARSTAASAHVLLRGRFRSVAGAVTRYICPQAESQFGGHCVSGEESPAIPGEHARERHVRERARPVRSV